MDKKLIKKLKQLTEIPSVSGNERECVAWFLKQLKPVSDKIFIDEVGNLIAIKGKPKIYIFSHLDKIGYMVSHLEKEKVKLVPLAKGKGLPGQAQWPVVILGKQNVGGILTETNDAHELTAVVPQGALKDISVGDFVGLAPNFFPLSGSTFCSQGLDNKLGILAASEVFKKTENIGIVGTVQEEAFKLGAKVAAWRIKPPKVVVLDVTYDENPEKEYPIKAGFGPAICLKDDLLPDQKLVKGLIKTAKKYKLSYQLEVLESGGSDASSFYDLGGGIPFVFVGIPIKNMHTPYEIGTLADLKNAIKLLTKFIASI